MINKILIALLIFLPLESMADKSVDFWWVYLAQYKKGPGTTLVNMALKPKGVDKRYPYLVRLGVKFPQKRKDGFPDRAQYKMLSHISDTRLKLIRRHTPFIHAGTFTHGYVRTDYVYVQKTGGLKKALARLYSLQFPKVKYRTVIKRDEKWEAYFQFIFPNAATIKHYQKDLVKLGYLDRNGNVVDDRIQKFWRWFHRNSKKLAGYLSSRQFNRMSKMISSELKKIDADLTYEAGSPKHTRPAHEIAISADGVRRLYTLVKRIVYLSPEMREWKIVAFRQPKPGSLKTSSVRFSDIELGADKIWFRLFVQRGYLRLALYIKGYSQKAGLPLAQLNSRSKRYIKAAYILLDNALGEEVVMRKIATISFAPVPKKPAERKGLKPFTDLPAAYRKLSGLKR